MVVFHKIKDKGTVSHRHSHAKETQEEEPFLIFSGDFSYMKIRTQYLKIISDHLLPAT